MDLKAIQRGAFDLVEAVRFLADKMDALEGALQAGGSGPNMDAGRFAGANLGKMEPGDLAAREPGDTVLVVAGGLRGLLNDRLVQVLERAGYDTVASIAGATDEALRAVSGVGPVTLREIRELIPGK